MPPPNPVVGVRGMVPGDRVLVRQDFSDPDHSPSGGLVGLSCGAAGGFTECPKDRDNFIHRCVQSRMGGAQLGSRTLQGTWSPQQASQHINLLEMEATSLCWI